MNGVSRCQIMRAKKFQTLLARMHLQRGAGYCKEKFYTNDRVKKRFLKYG